MSAVEFSSLLIGLKAFRTEFKRLNRTVRHVMSLASQGTGLVRGPRCQQIRHVPFPGGVRRDLYSWDFLDSQVSGEADLRRYSRLAQRVGGAVDGLEGTPAARLLPGSFQDIVGNQANLFRHDYWLFVVHHLGWIGHLPFECRRRWKLGRTIRDKEFSLRSDLPVNIVQASIDALSILIGAISQEPVDAEPDPEHGGGELEPQVPRRCC